MSNANNPDKDDDQIEEYHRLNLLKEKVGGEIDGGPGQISQEAINNAKK